MNYHLKTKKGEGVLVYTMGGHELEEGVKKMGHIIWV